MAHVAYSTVQRVRRFLGPDRALAVLDRDGDGSEDPGTTGTGSVSLVDDALARVANRIDGAVGGRYTVPFAAITDSTPTPEYVSDLTDLGVAALLYEWLQPNSDDAKAFRERFEEQIKAIQKGVEVIPGGAEKSATRGDGSVAWESQGTHAAGAVDSSGNQTAAWSYDSAVSSEQSRGL